MGRIRESSTFAAGQRNIIGRYDVPMDVSLLGFGIGMINEDCHMAGSESILNDTNKNKSV